MERLHRFLSRAGVASRRKSEELIAAGRVKVNGETVSVPGSKVDPEHDRVEVDGRPVALPHGHAYWLLNKPAGYVSTVRDPQGRPTVVDLLNQAQRLYPVGRLDQDSEGLLLLTDDGELTQRLTHPRYEHEKEYQVLVKGQPTQDALHRLSTGVELEDGLTSAAQVTVLRSDASGTWLRFIIHEGRKRQLRRMCDAVGHPVRRLIRVRMGPLTLDGLLPGQYRPLTIQERTRLAKQRAWTKSEEVALPHPNMIAIDGPAAAGKSTIGELLAEELDYLYFDTGVMYRAVTWAALQRSIPIEDEAAVSTLAQELRIDVLQPTVQDGRQYTVCVDGQDVTWDLRRPEVDYGVSPVSAYPAVRAALTAQQRRIGLQGKVVMVGRDVGTVVLPEAPLKIYLDATVEARARRRYLENRQHGQKARYADILRAMRRRDQIDSQRDAAPLRPAEDAVIIDTTDLQIEQVMVQVRELIQQRDS